MNNAIRIPTEHVDMGQETNGLPILVIENVAFAEVSARPLDPKEALLVGLSHRLDHFPSQLSGGEQQRSPLPA